MSLPLELLAVLYEPARTESGRLAGVLLDFALVHISLVLLGSRIYLVFVF